MRPAALLLLALALAPAVPAGSASTTPREFQDTGERFRTPLLGREYRLLVDGAGEKALADADGRFFDSAEAAVRAEEATLPLARRVVHPELWPLLDDPARAGERVRVVLVLRRQPVRDAGVAARALAAPLVGARLARIRAVLDGIAPFRRPDPERVLQLGERIEEEARLLSPGERAELRALRGEIRDIVRAMRRDILEEAKPLCALDQAPVAEAVERLPGGTVLARSFVLSAVVAEVPAGSLASLAGDLPALARILAHGVRRPGLNTSVGTLGATTWSGNNPAYDGSSSTRVAVMDTGIDSAHPALSSVLVAQAVRLSVGQTDPYFQDNASSTDDIFGHGSHVGGIVMSQDATYKGVAPGGGLMNAKCGYNSAFGGNLQDGDIMSAGDWAADNGADAVNASFGGGAYTDGSSDISLWFDALVDGLGVFAAVAAGNEGPGSGTVGSPGDAYNVVTVGSLDDRGTATHTDNIISSFSSRGALDDGRRKPDLCAPGSSITSCNYQWEGGGTGNDFVAYDGTSMATPHIAGAAALLLDYASTWRPQGLKALLLSTTRNTSPYPSNPDNSWGWGAADLSAAFTSRGTVFEGSLTSTGPAFVFLQVPTLNAGKRATLCWNRDVSWNNASTPNSYRAAVDLDLYAYDEATGAARGSAQGSLNPVEQVAATSTTSLPLLKVKRKGSFPSGQTTVDFAVATEGSGMVVVAAPPSLSCDLVLGKEFAKPGDVFTVDATLSVTGDLSAISPTVVLSLPAGYALQSGSLSQPLLSIVPGGSRGATWTVVAGGGVSGTAVIGVSGSCTVYGETFTSPAATADQPFDAVGPTGAISVAGGAAARMTPDVTVGVFASDDSTGVTDMRVRNAGEAWGAWTAFDASFPWTLAEGEGQRSVEVQLMDAAGNLSGILSDSILIDLTAPTGSFVLSGGATYLLPDQALTAETTSGDGAAGSGVADFRVRWTAGGAWSPWIPLDGDPLVALERPAQDGTVEAEGQFRDGAGNLSPSAFDGIHLIPDDPPSLTAVKSYKGSLSAGGDMDAFVIGALPGDLVSVKIKSAPSVKGAEFLVDADLFDPSGALVSAGRFPLGASRPGIAKYTATLAGEHWIVLRASGADAAAGGSYSLTVKIVTAKGNKRVTGPVNPSLGTAYYTFTGVEGNLAVGVVNGPVSGPLTLEAPDGSFLPVAIGPAAGGVKVLGLYLGQTGTYVLGVPSSGPLLVDLRMKPPRKTKVVETGE